MAVTIDIRAIDNYSRELNVTRREIALINQRIAENRRTSLNADAAQKQVIATLVKRDRAEKAVLTAQAQRITLERRTAVEAARSYGQHIQGLNDIDEAVRNSTRTFRVLQGYLTSYAAGFASQGIIDGFLGIVDAANNLEGAVNSLDALGENGEAVAKQLIEIARAEDGITFDSLRVAVTRFRAANLSIERATNVARGFGRQLALMNVSVQENTNFFRQLTQAYAGNNAEGDDLRTLFEVLPQLSDLSTRALGQQVQGWKTLRPAIEAADVSVREWVELTAQVAAADAQIDTSRFVIQQERLTETIQDLQREIGTRLLPILSAGARETSTFIRAFSAGGFTTFTAGTIAASAAAIRLTRSVRTATVVIQGAVAQQSLLGAAQYASAAATTVLQARVIGFVGTLKAATAAVVSYQIAWSAALPILTAVTVAIGYLAVRARNAKQEVDSFTATLGGIGDGIRFDEALGRVRTFSDFTQAELRQGINALITERERIENEIAQINESFSRFGVGTVEETLQRIPQTLERAFGRETVARAQELVTQIGIVNRQIETFNKLLTETPVAPRSAVDNIGIQAAEAADAVVRARERLRRAEDEDTARSAAAQLRTALLQAAAVEQAQAVEIEDRARFAARIVEIRLKLRRDIENIEHDLSRALTRVFKDEERAREVAARAAARINDIRIEAARNARHVEVEAFEAAAAAGKTYAEALRELDSVSQRNNFVALVERLQNQGQSFEDAIANAQSYIAVIGAISPTVSRADVEHGKFNSTLGQTATAFDGLIDRTVAYSGAIGAALTLIRAFQRAQADVDARLEAGQSRAEQREQEVFENPPTGRTLDDVRREAGEEGAEFLRRHFQTQERETERSLDRQYREYRRFYSGIGDLAVSAAFGQVDSFAEAAKQLIIQATRDLVRLAITRQVTAAKEIAIDTAVTNARVANQARLQAAIARTAAANQASAAGAGVGGLSLPGLGSIGGLASGGAGALGVAGALFPTQFRNLFSGLGTSLVAPIAEAIGGSEANSIRDFFIKFDDGTVRKVRDRANTITNRNR